LKTIKADEHLKMIPVVALTSSRLMPDLIEFYKHGVNAYVVSCLFRFGVVGVLAFGYGLWFWLELPFFVLVGWGFVHPDILITRAFVHHHS
jgi:hypothetical protein